ncbi:MAG: PaaX family transcriptional regulator [Actinomycetota bacterium]|nr:PaaX family transcriptional regulator [Actinomycetota bacterium]
MTHQMAGADLSSTRPGRPSPPGVAARRHEFGTASASSYLLTVLGEFVLPRQQPVWTAALTDTLELLGIEHRAARQALARTGADGLIASRKVGRRAQWNLTPIGRRLLSNGAERIYNFATETLEWDGEWLVLLVSVPETERGLRRRARTRLAWAGFGSPAPGVWVTPRPVLADEAREVLADLGLNRSVFSFVGEHAGIGHEPDLVDRAWDLPGIAARYDRFLATFADIEPADDTEALLFQIHLVHEWRRFPFLDPQLPTDLLPEKWVGRSARLLFHDRHDGWRAGAEAQWRRVSRS